MFTKRRKKVERVEGVADDRLEDYRSARRSSSVRDSHLRAATRLGDGSVEDWAARGGTMCQRWHEAVSAQQR